jgi:hypothetical protein
MDSNLFEKRQKLLNDFQLRECIERLISENQVSVEISDYSNEKKLLKEEVETKLVQYLKQYYLASPNYFFPSVQFEGLEDLIEILANYRNSISEKDFFKAAEFAHKLKGFITYMDWVKEVNTFIDFCYYLNQPEIIFTNTLQIIKRLSSLYGNDIKTLSKEIEGLCRRQLFYEILNHLDLIDNREYLKNTYGIRNDYKNFIKKLKIK